MNCPSISKSMDKVLDRNSISFDLLHCIDEPLEVRNIAVSIRVDICLLIQNDLVNEPSWTPRDWWEPNAVDTGQPPLKRLEEDHEVPRGKDQSLHEDP